MKKKLIGAVAIAVVVGFTACGGGSGGGGGGTTTTALKGLAAGAGVLFPISSIKTKAAADYAYTDMGDLGGVHRLSLRILF